MTSAYRRLRNLEQRIDDQAALTTRLREDLVTTIAELRRAESRVGHREFERDQALELAARVRNPSLDWHEQRQVLDASPHPTTTSPYWYFPAVAFNPYVELLYAELPTVGWAPEPLASWSDVDRIAPGEVLHLHWTKFATSRAKSAEQALRSVDTVLERLDRAIDRGVRFLWSVHEAFPHECDFPEAEIRLRSGLGARAELIHVLHDSTANAVGENYELPVDKVAVVEHPLYTSTYADFTSRAAARATLGIPDDAMTFLAFGAIRPYKGLDRLLAVAERLRRVTDRPFVVLVAGATNQARDLGSLVLDAASDPNTILLPEGVPNDFVHVLFRAADVSVLPYRAFLNSGVAMLSLSFGTPALLPRNAVTADLDATGGVRYFTIDDDESLFTEMCALLHDPPEPVVLPTETVERYGPATIATQFARLIEARL